MCKEALISTSFMRLNNALVIAKDLINNVPSIDILIICQLFDKPINTEFEEYDLDGVRIIYSETKGLSISRNIALNNAKGDYLWILDDDVKPLCNNVLRAFEYLESSSDLDFITCQYLKEDGTYAKKYPLRQITHTTFSLMNVSSIEILLRRKSFLHYAIKFDERFGIGSLYKTGEENIILTDAIKCGLKGAFIPLSLSIHPEISSGSRFENVIDIESKGAILKRIFSRKSYFLIFPFYFKRLFNGELNNIGFLRSFLAMFKGANSIK